MPIHTNYSSIKGEPQDAKHQDWIAVPPWLQKALIQLQPYMVPGGTIEVGGFQFNDKELSRLAGMTVRQAP